MEVLVQDDSLALVCTQLDAGRDCLVEDLTLEGPPSACQSRGSSSAQRAAAVASDLYR